MSKRTKTAIISISAALVLIIGAMVIIMVNDSDSYEKQYKLGLKYLSEKKYEKAIDHFDKALEIKPEAVDAMIGKADGYTGLKEYDTSIDILEDAQKIDDKDVRTYERIITVYCKTEDFEAANEENIKAFERDIDIKEVPLRDRPELNLKGGTYDASETIKVKNLAGAKIYYTTDGTIPTTASSIYDNGITVDKNVSFELIITAIDEDGLMGVIGAEEYKFDIAAPALAINDSILEYIGTTYGDLQKEYGGIAFSTTFEGGYYFKSGKSDLMFGFTTDDIIDPQDITSADICVALGGPAKLLINNFNSALTVEELMSELGISTYEFDEGGESAYYLYFNYDEYKVFLYLDSEAVSPDNGFSLGMQN